MCTEHEKHMRRIIEMWQEDDRDDLHETYRESIKNLGLSLAYKQERIEVMERKIEKSRSAFTDITKYSSCLHAMQIAMSALEDLAGVNK